MAKDTNKITETKSVETSTSTSAPAPAPMSQPVTQAITTTQVAVAPAKPAIKEWTQDEKDAAVKQHGSWSNVFRALTRDGKTKGEISKLTGKRYQHVRNVLITPLTSKSA